MFLHSRFCIDVLKIELCNILREFSHVLSYKMFRNYTRAIFNKIVMYNLLIENCCESA